MSTASYCDRILFLKDGKLIYELQKGARSQEEIKEYVKDFKHDFIY